LPDKSDPNYTREIGSIERAAKNHPIQGTSADMTKLALVFTHNRFEKEGIKGGIVHTVHDEIVSEVVEEQAEFAAKLQQEEMIRAGETFLKNVPIVADAVVSDIWEH
jgi:DNA polymerase I-like protein with 3'-5' exonuclease and polymerase domains